MDEQRRPRSREKKVVSEGKGVEKHGEGLGTGPVNNTGNYEDRRAQQGGMPGSSVSQSQQRPVQDKGTGSSQHDREGRASCGTVFFYIASVITQHD